jgi:tetratricopeptide (TPR) repeat protein
MIRAIVGRHMTQPLTKRARILSGAFLIVAVAGSLVLAQEQSPTSRYAGSVSCRECHERFYQLWSTSLHGLAMQPYTEALAKDKLTPQADDVVIGAFRYRAEIGGGAGYVLETGADGTQKQYRIIHALGGKNVYYFLTPMDRGRLQTLPVAYDVHKKEWFDTALSGVRHFPGQQRSEEPLGWQEWPYTFNTACYGCHVSQLATNYDPKTDIYHTTWAEPGINCETCHGPSAEHNRVAREAPKGQPPADMKIISTKPMTKEQRNHLCASCHAKATAPLTPSFLPGEKFFDHFDLVTLENPDYYVDGRDLGENYTYTSWLMSPCVQSGKLECLHCHTSSGRYRFKKDEDANKACLPCHEERVNNAPAHTRHEEKSPGNRCISCHMPMTSFARMNRSDHSMLPPVPAATMAYQSPNACNLCHADKDAAWADKQVREWRSRDYQAPLLRRASLIDAARKRDWRKHEEMLRYISSKDRDEVFAASLIRLIPASAEPTTVPTLLQAAQDRSPLVRAAAVEALATVPSQQSLQAVAAATGDDYRLVRVRAAAALAAYPGLLARGQFQENIRKANEEYLASLSAWPDQWTSHYNLGNYHLNRGELKEAIVCYDRALAIEPRAAMVLVNASISYSRMGNNQKAEESLRKALETAPENAAANFNMGLLKAEQNDAKQAELSLRAALKHDPQMAQAALNLCVLLAQDRLGEAVGFCREAAKLRPDDPKIAYTLAFYLNQKGETAEALTTLQAVVEKYPNYQDAQMLLRSISATGQNP